MKRCKWCNLNNPKYVEYHDNEWCKLNKNDKYTPSHTLATPKQAAQTNTCLKVWDTNNADTGGIISIAEIRKIPTTLKANTTATEVMITKTVLIRSTGTPRVRAKGSSKQADVKSR